MLMPEQTFQKRRGLNGKALGVLISNTLRNNIIKADFIFPMAF